MAMDDATREALSNRHFFTRGLKASDEYHQFWIRYKPERVARKNIKRKWIVPLGLILGGLAFVCFRFAQLSWPFFLMATSFVYLAFRFPFFASPTHLSISDEGLRLHWLRTFCNVSGQFISWDMLTHVNIVQRRYFGAVEPMLEFNLVRDRLPAALSWLNPRPKRISIALNGIASSDDRKRLQLALQRFLPAYRVDPSVPETLGTNHRISTYTDLWMDALTSSKQRQRREQLGPGDRLHKNRYEVVKELGAGGQSVVYEGLDRDSAKDPADQKVVVLKEFILPAHACESVQKRVLDNIHKEASLLRNLKHPNIVKLTDHFVEDQRAYLVLERIKGTTLKQMVKHSGPFSEEQAVLLGLQMCEILSYLHTHNIVHRDFTPDNLMMGHGDILKLIDFNVAQQLEGDPSRSVVGKHSYIPPEQYRGKASSQSDIYAAGASLFYLLTGIEPEPIETSHPRHEAPAISEEMDRVVARATAPEVNDRYVDCLEWRLDLQRMKNRSSN